MGIRFRCHLCGSELNVKSSQAGKRGRCPSCRGSFRIPAADAEYSLRPEERMHASPVPIGSSSTHGPAGVPPHNTDRSAPVREQPTPEVSRSAAELPDTKPFIPPQVAKPTDAHPETVPAIADQNQTTSAEVQPQMSAAATFQPRASSEAPNATWYVRPESGGQYGPVPSQSVWQWLLENRMGSDSLVWREDWPAWLPAGQVFQDYFRGSPIPTDPGDPASIAAIAPPPVGFQPGSPGNPKPHRKGTDSEPTSYGQRNRDARKQQRQRNYRVLIIALTLIFLILLTGLIFVLWQQS